LQEDNLIIIDIQSNLPIFVSPSLISVFSISNYSNFDLYTTLSKLVEDEFQDELSSFFQNSTNNSIETIDYRIQLYETVKWFHHKKKFIENGNNQLVLHLFNDITHLKTLSQMIDKNYNHLDLVFHNSEIPMLIIDSEKLTILDKNRSINKMFHFERNKIIGLSLNFIFEDLGILNEIKHFINSTQDVLIIKTNILNANSIQIPVEILIGKFNFTNKKCLLLKFRDQKKSYTSSTDFLGMNVSLTTYMHAVSSATILSISDPTGTIIYVNENFSVISKYSRDELIGKKHNIIKSDYHPKSFYEDLWKTISNGKIWRNEIKNKAKDGTFYWVDTYIMPFFDEMGNIIQYLSIRNDISQRKFKEEEIEKLNQSLLEQNKKLREFSFINAHKIRGPLVSLLSLVELIKENESKDSLELLQQLNDTAFVLDESIKELAMILNPTNVSNNEPKAKFQLKKIFLIDDDTIQHMVNKINLKKMIPDSDIYTYTNGLIALDEMKIEKPDLILLDINMPIIDGWGVLDEMKKRDLVFPVLMLTSSCDPKDEEISMNYDYVKGFIMKPLSKDKIKTQLLNE
jgi:PAS domain S-box-containing protein